MQARLLVAMELRMHNWYLLHVTRGHVSLDFKTNQKPHIKRLQAGWVVLYHQLSDLEGLDV